MKVSEPALNYYNNDKIGIIQILSLTNAELKPEGSSSISLFFSVSTTFLAQVQNQTLMRENYILIHSCRHSEQQKPCWEKFEFLQRYYF